MTKSYRRQATLFPEEKRVTEYGGDITRGKRKARRPTSVKRPMHIVMRSTRARGQHSLLTRKNARYLAFLLPIISRLYGVRIYEQANSGNHLHLAIRTKTRHGLQTFLRVLSSKLALHVTGARKGKSFGKFWDQTAYTRIAEWGRAFTALKAYIRMNVLETAGLIPHQPRKRRSVARPAAASSSSSSSSSFYALSEFSQCENPLR